jgi:hypothetical protein
VASAPNQKDRRQHGSEGNKRQYGNLLPREAGMNMKGMPEYGRDNHRGDENAGEISHPYFGRIHYR